MKYIACLIITVLFATGCINNFVDQGQSTEGLVFNLNADPPRAFIGDNVRLIMDVENKDIKEYDNVTISIFDIGILEGRCDTFTFDKLLSSQQNMVEQQGQFKTFYCYAVTPKKIDSSEITTTVYAKATYNTSFHLVQIIEMVSENYYDAHRGEIEYKSRSYVYRDKNLEVAVDFSSDLPVIIRPGTETYMKIQITNIGNGFVKPIRDLKIKPAGTLPDIFMNCDFSTIEPINNVFPRQSCQLVLPEGVEYLTNFDAIVEFTYDYEVRSQTDVTIMRGY